METFCPLVVLMQVFNSFLTEQTFFSCNIRIEQVSNIYSFNYLHDNQ